jgi:hypothetical protein
MRYFRVNEKCPATLQFQQCVKLRMIHAELCGMLGEGKFLEAYVFI